MERGLASSFLATDRTSNGPGNAGYMYLEMTYGSDGSEPAEVPEPATGRRLIVWRRRSALSIRSPTFDLFPDHH
jgi:hypothetical protein